MKALTAKKMGEVGLKILSVNDMPKDKFKNQFKLSEAKWALGTQEGADFINRDPNNHEKVRNYLQEIVDTSSIPVESRPPDFLQSLPICAVNSPVQTGTPLSQIPAATQHHSIPVPIGGQEVIITDKGAYYSVAVLKAKLNGIYSISDFDKAFTLAMETAKVDPTVDYLSEVKKRSVCNKIKSAIQSVIMAAVDNVMEEK